MSVLRSSTLPPLDALPSWTAPDLKGEGPESAGAGPVSPSGPALALVSGTAGPDFIHRAGDGLVSPVGYVDLTGATVGDDILSGGDGDDIIFGDQGDDVLDGGSGDDSLNGGDGLDTADYGQAGSAITADLAAGTVQMANVAGMTRIGGEFLVNTETAGAQESPTITGLSGGGFVVTWQDQSGTLGDNSGTSIKAQMFDASGARVGGEFLVNTQTASDQNSPTITGLSGGGFVVTWDDWSGTLGDASSYSVKAQMFDAAGARVGGEFLVNTQTANSQSSPTITGLSTGGFVVTWSDQSRTLGDTSHISIKAQMFDAAGARIGGEFLVNTQTVSYQFSPTITGLAGGGFVVTWYDRSGTLGDSSRSSIKAQMFDAAGAKVGGEFLVNTQTGGYQSDPTITGLSGGGFVVTWRDESGTLGDASEYSVKAQMFDAAGARIGGEFLVNSQTAFSQYDPTITGLSGGGFVVAWEDRSGTLGDASLTSIKAQAFNSAGAKIGGELLVNTQTAVDQVAPTITGLSGGGFVVTWYDYSGTLGDANGTSIKAQIFGFGADETDALSSIENLIGSDFNDSLTGDASANHLDGGLGDDVLVGGLGADVLSGGAGDDIIFGDQGDDVLDGGSGNDSLNGGDGVDTADYGQAASAITADLAAGTAQMTGGMTRIGGEFLVNTQTSSDQYYPTITGLADGGFVVTWFDYSGTLGDAIATSIKAQMFDAAGAKVGGEFLVNTQTAGYQSDPTITDLSSGGFVVTWQDNSGTLGDASGYSIKAQMFDAVGARVGGEFLVNTNTYSNQNVPTVTNLTSGGFVVTWQDNSGTLGDASGTSIKAQMFDAAGDRIGGEFLVNTQTAVDQLFPTITGLAGGGFVVTWTDWSGTLGDAGAISSKAQMFDAAGTRVGEEFLVNTETTSSQVGPSITALIGGGFVVTWQDNSGTLGDSSENCLTAQIFDGAGARVGGEFLVNTQAQGHQNVPTIAALSGGGFVVTWFDESRTLGDTDGYSIKAQVFDPSGAKVGGEFLVNTQTYNNQYGPDITGVAGGGFVVTWHDQSGTLGDVSGFSIKAQIFGFSSDEIDTLSSVENLIGSNFNDSLTGDGGANRLDGGLGDDLLIGGLGDDQLVGGGGIDTADYGAALAGVIVDFKTGVASGGAGADSLSGIENLTGSAFNDRLTGFTGANLLDGGEGDDQLNGFGGDDSLIGGLGDDLLIGGAGNDEIDGGAGRDTASYRGAIAIGGVTVNLATGVSSGAQGADTLIRIDNLIGSDFDDVLTGDKGANQITGGAGNDSLNGGLGIDTVSYAEAGSAVSVSLLSGKATGGAGTDQLLGFENLIGSDFNDSLTGDGGANVLVGGAGDDLLDGQAGVDTADYKSARVGVVADLGAGTATLGLEVDSLVSIESLVGSKFADSLTGGLAANQIDGGGGSDLIIGGGGSDALTGGAGRDVFRYLGLTDSGGADLDLITDLGAKDRIDLAALDADIHTAGDQAFQQVAAFTGAAGQLRLTYDAGAQQTMLAVDVDGDGQADFALRIAGEHLSAAGWVM
jgi:Ca2+-binding RTX toxin-like protein